MKKKIKARRYWQRPKNQYLYESQKVAQYYSGFAADKVAPVFVLPADAASVERMVEQMAEVIRGQKMCDIHPALREVLQEQARAALAAIGIKGGKSE